jgi:putative addiction module component (TIGR02574 family)
LAVGGPLGTRELIEQALKLDPTDRLKLVDQVLHSLDEPHPKVEQIWIKEAEKRLTEYRSGKVRGIPVDDVTGPL